MGEFVDTCLCGMIRDHDCVMSINVQVEKC